MPMTRFVLYTIALLTGGYSALTWSLALLDHSAVAGLICAVTLIAAEAIRYCAPQPDRRPAVTFHDGRVRRIDAGPGSWAAIGRDAWEPHRHAGRPVWPFEIGAPE